VIAEDHFQKHENHAVVAGTRTSDDWQKEGFPTNLVPVPRGASRFELRILQDHVQGFRHKVIDSAALSTALASIKVVHRISGAERHGQP